MSDCANAFRKERLDNPTVPERRFTRLLNKEGMKYEREKIIEYGNGRFFIVDFYLPDTNTCIEIDGSSHQGKENYDKNRDQILTSLGYNVQRFSNIRIIGRETWHKIFLERGRQDARLRRRLEKQGIKPRPVNEPCPSCKETYGHSKFCRIVRPIAKKKDNSRR